MIKELFIIKYRGWIIALTIVVVLLSLFPLLKSKINSDLVSYLPDRMPAKINNDKIEKIFGIDDPLVIVFSTDDILNKETLTRLRDLSKDFNRMNEFSMVMSLFDAKEIRGEYGAMVVNPVIRRIPRSEIATEKLREQIKQNELVYGMLVSKDFHHCLLILNHEENVGDKQLMELVRSKLEEYPGREIVRIFGQPYLREEANHKIARDLILLLPIGLLIMFLFLWISLKDIRSVILPFSVVLVSILFTMALIPLFGWQISVIGILVPIMMIAIANNYGIHVIARYQELMHNYPHSSRSRIISAIVLFLRKPVIFTGLTTMVGIAGLIMHILLPAKQIGVVTVLGIAFALLLSLTFIPTIMTLFRDKGTKGPDPAREDSGVYRLLARIGGLVVDRPKWIIAIFLILLVGSGILLPRLKIAADFNNILPQKHEFNQALHLIDREFGGTKYLKLMFEGDVKDPELLKKMDKMEGELEKLEEVGDVSSIATVIRIISRALQDPQDPYYNRIPDTRAAVAQYLELYGMSGDPDDFEQFVNFDYTDALMNIQYHAKDLKQMNEVLNEVNRLSDKYGLKPVVGGYSLIEKELSRAVTLGQINSLIFAFLAIALLLLIIFRSLIAGLMGSFPLLFAVVCTFGIMSLTGIELNIVTALLSSISIGLGVDYTIHLFWRLKSELKNNGAYREAVIRTLTTTGRGISINAFSVIAGFAVLFLSSFPLIRSFAFLIISSILCCLFCALILIPALCLVFDPGFLKQATNSVKHNKSKTHED